MAVKVGLLGCGRIAQYFHLKLLATLPGYDLRALADASPELLQSAKGRAPAAATYADYKQLLKEADVEAVVICLPTGMHAESAIAAFEAGKHVYLEKPIAITGAEAQRVLDAWRASGKQGMIGFNYRFHPLYLEAKRRIDAGDVGQLVAIRSIFCSAAREVPGWKRQRATGGGVLLDLFSHHADLARFFTGDEIDRVFAQTRSARTEDDTASVELRMRNGLTMQSFHSMCTADVDRFEFLGDKATLVLDRYAATLDRVLPTRPKAGVGPAMSIARSAATALKNLVRPPSETSYHGALSSFAHALQTQTPVEVDLVCGLRSLAAIEAAEASSRTGSWAPAGG